MSDVDAATDAATVAHDLRLAVGRLARRLRQLYALRRGDQLTFTELAVLSRLHRDGPATASQLANGERVTAQAVGAAIAALHQRGLIDRTPDPRDRRKTIISLTDPGRSAFTVREQAVIDRMVQAVASGCTPAERRQLAAAAPLLERLADLLQPPRSDGAAMSDLHRDGHVEAFFDTFAAASDQLDLDRLAGLFAETFLAADPAGAQPVPRQAFLQALPRRAELFAAAGITRVVLADLRYQALDDTYVLARTDWRAERTTASTPVRLSSTFILRRDADRLQVVFYLNHQDLARALGVA